MALGVSSPRIFHVEVFESPHVYVLVGQTTSGLRLLQIARGRGESDALPTVIEEAIEREDLAERLQDLGGGIMPTKVLEADALLGMIRFLEGYYMLFVTRRAPHPPASSIPLPNAATCQPGANPSA